jgi:hypothetical protein
MIELCFCTTPGYEPLLFLEGTEPKLLFGQSAASVR